MPTRPNPADGPDREPGRRDFLGLKALIRRSLKKVAPKLYWERQLRNLRQAESEYEMRIAPLLCDRHKISIDVGAARGSYAVKICDHSASVIAFEARPAYADQIRQMVIATGLPIEVEGVALSDQAGLARLRILTQDGGRSTIESANALDDVDGSPRVEIRVPKVRLDDYELKEVGFLKVDVEGHEFAVLLGAEATIRESMPNLLVEIEDRHRANAISDVSRFLFAIGYEGFYFNERQLRPFSEFDKSLHQDPSHVAGWKDNWARTGVYINNFIFIPATSAEAMVKRLNAVR